MKTSTLRTLAVTPLLVVSCTVGATCLVPGCGWLQSHPNAPQVDEQAAFCLALHLDDILSADTTADEIAAALAAAADCKLPQAFVQNFAAKQKAAMVKYPAKILKGAQAAPITSSAPYPSITPSSNTWPAPSMSAKGAK